MQKADAIRRMKWAAEDAYLRSVGVKNALTGWNFWEEVNSMNRERPGGIQTQMMSGWNGWKKSKYAKRRMNKKLRREHQKITAEALRDYEYEQDRYVQFGYDDVEIGIKRHHQIWWDEWLHDNEYQEWCKQEYLASLEAMQEAEDRWWDEQNRSMLEEMDEYYDFDYGFPV